MTVSSTTRKAGPFAGNNLATTFPFSFKVFAKGDVKVLRVSPSSVSTSLTLDSDYSVQLNANQDANPGGWVTYPIAANVLPLAEGYQVVILGDLAYDQETDLTNSGGFYPQTVEDMADRSTIQIQQLAEIASRAIVVSEVESASPVLPVAQARANMVIGFDALGNLELYPITPAVGAGDLKNEIWNAGQDFTPGVSNSVPLSRAYGTKANLGIVVMAGVPQDPDSYSLDATGANLVFDAVIPAVGVNKIWCVGGTTLSQYVPPDQSIGDPQLSWIGLLFRAVDSVAALRALSASNHDRAYIAGYYGVNTPGGGAVYKDTTDTTSADNGVTVFVATDGTRWKRPPLGYATLTMAGAYGDGTSGSPHDDSTAIQACIDAMKGQTVIADAGKTFYCAGVTLNGTTYNNTKIVGEGWFLLKPDGGQSIYGGAWVGLLVQQCDGVSIDVKFNGNRANMTAREQIFCVGVAGASNLKIPFAEIKEIRGDGIYIGQANWQASSGNTNNVEIGLLKGSNTADDGRNLLSIISGASIHVKRVQSVQIGGVINGVVQPGGVDIEPDNGYETCYDIRIDSLDVVTAGTSGLAILGKSASGNDANLDWNCSQIVIGEARILRTGTSGSALAGSGFTRCADVKIVKGFYQFNSTPGAGPVIDFAQRFEADWTVNNVTYGGWLAPGGALLDHDVKFTVSGFTQAGLLTTNVQQGRVRGRMFSSVGGNTTYGIRATNNGRVITQANVAYEVDMPYDNVMAAAFYNDASNPVTFGTGSIARDSDWSGYATYAGTCNALIPLQDVIGMTWAASVPTNGTWHWQTRVNNSQPAATGGKTTIAWARLNSGSNNVLGNDWAACVCTNS